MPGTRFWSEWTHDVTSIARQKARLRQVRYEHEKTKKGQITPNPQAGANSECSPAQTHADIAASGISRFVKKDSIHRMGTIKKVSIGGPIITIMSRTKNGSPSKVGPPSSVMIPDAARTTTIIIEGKKLISPARSTYLSVDMRLSKSIESNHPRCISGFGVPCCFASCSGSKRQLLNCPVRPVGWVLAYKGLEVKMRDFTFLCPAHTWPSVHNFRLYLPLGH